MLCLVALGGSITGAASGSGKFARLHFIANCTIGDGHFEQVRMAGLRSLPFDSTHCLGTAEEVKQVLEEIVAEKDAIAGRVALVVGNVGLPGEEHIARAIREGVYVFLIENSIDIAKYGLDLGQHFVINLRPDNARGGRLIGKELCRIAGDKNQWIVLLYGADPALDLRVDLAIERFKEECPDSRLHVAHTRRGDWSAEQALTMFRSLFLIDSAITTVLCANDAMAAGVIKAAGELMDPRKASRLFVSGFDDNDNQKSLRRSRRMFATVNLGTTVANESMWSILPKVENPVYYECRRVLHGMLLRGRHPLGSWRRLNFAVPCMCCAAVGHGGDRGHLFDVPASEHLVLSRPDDYQRCGSNSIRPHSLHSE